MTVDTRTPRGRLRNILALWRTSVRVRLALTYAATLALALSLFAAATSLYLSRSSISRADASLVETMQLVRQALDDEANEHSTLDIAAADAVREIHFSDRRVLLYTADQHLLAVSDSAPLSDAVPLRALSDLRAPLLAPLLAVAASRNAGRPSTIGSDNASVRAIAQATRYRGVPITVVVLRGLATEEEASETFVAWLIAAIPIALIFAVVGGYLLARASLAPALALAEQAERISAASLDARLSVANPEDELGRLAGVLNALLGRLQQAFSRQRTFMADASHELRTPIAVVRGAADVALTSPAVTVESLRDSLKTVRVEGIRMTRIVNDLFLLARADSVAQPVTRELLFLEEIVTDASRAGRMLGNEHGVTVTADADVEAPFVGDANLIGRLLLNLVDNAVQFSPRGAGVHIALARCESPELPDGRALSGPWYSITVDDEGPGVDGALHATLFERFVRAVQRPAPDERRASGGAGLGLAIARWVTDVHAGHVWHDASKATGARFVVMLPEPRDVPGVSAHHLTGHSEPDTATFDYGRRVESGLARRSRAS